MVNINTDVKLSPGLEPSSGDIQNQLPIDFQVGVEETDDGEMYLNFPDDLMDALNLKIGDTIIWTDNNDGSWLLTPLRKK